MEVETKPSPLWQKIRGYVWTGSMESPIPAATLYKSLKVAARPNFGFYFMLIMAGTIATIGLLGNSAATIIGAMIVAPLMNPILALAYALITGRKQWALRSLFTIINGALVTIAVAWLITSILTVSVVESEIIARTQPTLLDLGVAAAAGAAGGFANTRKSIANSIAGVAIAVALVPPLSVVGIGLSLGSGAIPGIGLNIGRDGIAYGAALLFLTNLVAIVLTSGLIFSFQGYGSLRKSLTGLGAWMAIAIIIFVPLGRSFRELLLRNYVRGAMAEYSRTSRQTNTLNARLISYSVVLEEEGHLYVELEGIASREITREEIEEWRDYLSEYMGRPVHLRVRWIPLMIREVDAERVD